MTTGIAQSPITRRTGFETALDVERIRKQFPILKRSFHGKPMVYLDNAATTQKPAAVIDADHKYYEEINANVHRGVYALSQEATDAYEGARQKIAAFINAASAKEIIFTRGTTESINLVAASYGRQNLKPGDVILISAMEHHSNIVPWQLIAEQSGATLAVIPMDDRGQLRLEELDHLLTPRVKIVAIVHLSNSLGTINPVEKIIVAAHRVGAKVLVDGAQWVAHGPTDVRAMDADFYAFSGHKLYGPTGIGVLYGKAELLEAMPPYQGGGDMISSVTFQKTTYNALPYKFEAGTPNIAGGIVLGEAIDFVNGIGWPAIMRHEEYLLDYGTKKLQAIGGVRLIGTAENKGSVLSFVVDNPAMSPLDVGMRLDAMAICVRTGHHCCQPVMDRLAISATARASLAIYNTTQELDALADGLTGIIAAEKAKRDGIVAKASAALTADLQFPQPAADSPDAAAQEMIEAFDFLGDWEARHQFLVEMGDKLLPMPAELKTEANRVRGCQSTVHIFARHRPGSAEGLDFLADSDAAIVRGLIALLQRVYAGQNAKQILEFDIEGFLTRLGLSQHLSMGRRNGLAGMIQRIRSAAGELANNG